MLITIRTKNGILYVGNLLKFPTVKCDYWSSTLWLFRIKNQYTSWESWHVLLWVSLNFISLTGQPVKVNREWRRGTDWTSSG